MYGCDGKVLSLKKTHAPIPKLNIAIGKPIIGVALKINSKLISIRKINNMRDSYIYIIPPLFVGKILKYKQL